MSFYCIRWQYIDIFRLFLFKNISPLHGYDSETELQNQKMKNVFSHVSRSTITSAIFDLICSRYCTCCTVNFQNRVDSPIISRSTTFYKTSPVQAHNFQVFLSNISSLKIQNFCIIYGHPTTPI